VAAVTEDYLLACRERGILEARIVHGRGTGTQRAVVRRLLASLPWVESFADAPPQAGGWGATLARLAPLEKK
jgi:DNA-nicking Smr family endonuclease